VQTTVADVKAELLLELDVPLNLQRLLLKGKPLQPDTKLLSDYGIAGGSSLTLQVKKATKPVMQAGFLDRAKSAPPKVSVAAAPADDAMEELLERAATGPASDTAAVAAAARAAEQDQSARACIGEAYSALALAAASTDAAGGGPDYTFEGGGADVQTELAAALEAMAAQLPTLEPLLAAAHSALGEEKGEVRTEAIRSCLWFLQVFF
jgi:hypothetical protein